MRGKIVVKLDVDEMINSVVPGLSYILDYVSMKTCGMKFSKALLMNTRCATTALSYVCNGDEFCLNILVRTIMDLLSSYRSEYLIAKKRICREAPTPSG